MPLPWSGDLPVSSGLSSSGIACNGIQLEFRFDWTPVLARSDSGDGGTVKLEEPRVPEVR